MDTNDNGATISGTSECTLPKTQNSAPPVCDRDGDNRSLIHALDKMTASTDYTHDICEKDEPMSVTSYDSDFSENDGNTSLNFSATTQLGRNTNGKQRAKINMRERRRMHDLNIAMDSLREVMPYANGPSVRKLSKIATLSLARNYIQMLTKSVEDLKRLLDDVHRNNPVPFLGHTNLPVHPYGLLMHQRQFSPLDITRNRAYIHSGYMKSYVPRDAYSVPPEVFRCDGQGCCNVAARQSVVIDRVDRMKDRRN